MRPRAAGAGAASLVGRVAGDQHVPVGQPRHVLLELAPQVVVLLRLQEGAEVLDQLQRARAELAEARALARDLEHRAEQRGELGRVLEALVQLGEELRREALGVGVGGGTPL